MAQSTAQPLHAPISVGFSMLRTVASLRCASTSCMMLLTEGVALPAGRFADCLSYQHVPIMLVCLRQAEK